MRPAQKSNRSRGRGNRKGGGGGGGNNINRVYDSAGPEGKVRGTPQQIIDKYTSLARDAQTSGDRVAAENFLQHAEHYQRILIQAMGAQEQARREQNAQAEQPEETDAQSQSAQPAEKTEAPTPAPAPAQTKAPAEEIGGMTTIDAEGGQESSLLVEAEDTPVAQPRRNGNGRRRSKPKTDDTAEAAPAAEQPAADPVAKGDAAEGAPAET